MASLTYHTGPNGRKIAFRHAPGEGPALVFLPGYMSDMSGSKASALFDAATSSGRACLLLDYSGCGASEGEFATGTLTRWRDEVLALIHARINGQVILVGSSMGGWLMLLVGLALGDRLAGLVGIAPAPDFTQWGVAEQEKARLLAGETVRRENAYGSEPTPIHAEFWQDAQEHCVLGSAIPLDCPVRLLHGKGDTEVPPEISLRLSAALRSTDVQVTLVKGGDHRLSRAGDIALLLRTVDALVTTLKEAD